MCYLNINANLRFIRGDKKEGEIIIDSYEIDNAEKPELKNLIIKVDFCLMGSINQEHKARNIVNQNGKLECILRIKKKVGDFNKIITNFDVDTKDYGIQSEEFLWINVSKSLALETFPLPEVYKGEYYVDLVVKRVVNREDEDDENNDKLYQIQTRTILSVI